jgi:hypothetical protein
MQVPAQPVLDPGPLGDQVLAVAEQQLDLPGGAVLAAVGQVGFLQRHPSHRECIDGMRLAWNPAGLPHVGHQPSSTNTICFQPRCNPS